MSGGYFDYRQYVLGDIADEIDDLTSDNAVYPPDIVERFAEARKTLKLAQQMVHRIDWLVSGDDGDDAFRRRWEKEVEPLR